MVNGTIVTVFKVPAIVATLGTLSIFRGIDYLVAGPHQVPVAALPPGFVQASVANVFGIPLFVLIAVVIAAIGTVLLRWTRFGRQDATQSAQPGGGGHPRIPSRRVVFVAFAVCGLLAGVAGVMWVSEYGTINGTTATGAVLAIVAAVVVGGVAIFGGSGTVAGAALGALFLGFIANGLVLVGLSQFWLQAIYGAVILLAVSADAVLSRRLLRATAERRIR